MKPFDGVSDDELWVLGKNHAAPAFGALFVRHVDAVYNHCFRRTGSWSMAEDLTSAVFLDAWRRRSEVRLDGESILPWLLAVANKSMLNASRSVRRQRRLLAKLPQAVAVPDFSEEAIERIDDERAMCHLLSVFNRLNRAEQDVLSLCDWAGLSYANAAVALAVPIGTVRSRLSRAREHLRELSSNDRLPAPGSSPNPLLKGEHS